jgi:hypothetical protein
MGLFDAFSSSDETRTLNAGLQQNKSLTKDGIAYGKKYLDRGVTALNTGAASGQDYLADANAMARGDITNATNLGINYLDQGVGQAAGAITQGIAPQEALYGRGLGGIDAYSALLQNPDSIYDSELYKSREQAGIDGLNREANSRGMLSSGNNTQDILDYMKQGGLDYFNTLANAHQPYFGLAQSGAQGMQSGYNALGGLYDNLGTNKANLAAQSGSALANLQSQYGQNASNVATGTGQNLAELYQGQGQLGAGAYSGLGKSAQDNAVNVATAQQAADAASWDALLKLGSGLTGGLTSYVGAGGRFA